MLMSQELAGFPVRVRTIGSAAETIGPRAIAPLAPCGRLLIATDADPGGEMAAVRWAVAFPGKTDRIRPPGKCKDWTDAYVQGYDLNAFCRDVLGSG